MFIMAHVALQVWDLQMQNAFLRHQLGLAEQKKDWLAQQLQESQAKLVSVMEHQLSGQPALDVPRESVSALPCSALRHALTITCLLHLTPGMTDFSQSNQPWRSSSQACLIGCSRDSPRSCTCRKLSPASVTALTMLLYFSSDICSHENPLSHIQSGLHVSFAV